MLPLSLKHKLTGDTALTLSLPRDHGETKRISKQRAARETLHGEDKERKLISGLGNAHSFPKEQLPT